MALLWSAPAWPLTEISSQPLTGINLSYGPNVVLALSVEYPTAGPAYGSKTLDKISYLQQQYRGYFDSNKCYRYENGAFVPAAAAETEVIGNKTYYGLCDGNSNYFSGNILNFLTMSAIDVFRKTLTGGNRAKGTETTAIAYTNGDTATETYLRRAKVVGGQNANYFGTKSVTVSSLGNLFERVLPKNWSKASNGANVTRIEFTNTGFSVNINQVYYGKTGTRETGYYAWSKQNSNCRKVNNQQGDYWCKTGEEDVYGDVRELALAADVVVKVCDPNVGLESNCVQYGNYWKPEGLLQQYSKNDKGEALDANRAIRVAAFGYLNIGGRNGIDGGVLRARMKTLINTQPLRFNQGETPSIAVGSEWDTETGQFKTNPDNASEGNSGVINYLNKFGDRSIYKQYDPGAELYYTALRYLRNGAWNGDARRNEAKAPYQRSNLDDQQKDGFPVIYDWEDPLYSVNGAQCRSNTIIYIGDTNTWDDWNLPNFGSSDGKVVDDIKTQAALEQLLRFEGSNWGWHDNVGAGDSFAGIAGLAYWARMHDIRPDIPGNQYGNNFMVDVKENDVAKGGARPNVRNAYYLAAKYGGFDAALINANTDGYKNPNDLRASWTDDATGKTSDSSFSDGVPRNFAFANNPDNMVSALQKAMASAGAQSGVSQTSLGTEQGDVAGDAQRVVLSDGNKAGGVTVQSQFSGKDWSGNVWVYSVGLNAGSLAFTQKWSLAEALTAKYHNTSNAFKGRNVWSWSNGAAKAVAGENQYSLPDDLRAKILSGVPANTPSNADEANADVLMQYALGDRTYEDKGSLRRRSNVLGTIVNSQIVGFRGNDNTQYFAVAANDGMLHIFSVSRDGDTGVISGQEEFAYMPSTAMAGLHYLASKNYAHRYLNDGSLSVQTLGGETYLVGSTGRGDSAEGGKSAVYVVKVDKTQNGAKMFTLVNEFTDDDLGHVLGEPVLTLDASGSPVAIFGSGYAPAATAQKGYLYVLNLKDGSAQKVELGDPEVGAVTGFDSNGDGKTDRVYLGDNSGHLWRVDNASDNTWQKAYNGRAMYAGSRAITGTPYAELINGTVYVVAGSGRYLNTNDLSDGVQNYAYGFFDNYSAAACAEPAKQSEAPCTTIADKDLVKQSVIGDARQLEKYSNLLLGSVTKEKLKGGERGWRVQLPLGGVIAGHADIQKKRIAVFAVVNQKQDDNTCSVSGTTSGLFVDIRNGGEYSSPVLDTNGDGVVDKNDAKGGYLTKTNLLNPEQRIFHTDRGDYAFADPNDEDNIRFGLIVEKPKVRRLSWRELFSY